LLSFLNYKVSDEVKRKIQAKILSFAGGNWEKRTIKLKEIPAASRRNLWDLVDQSSICALRLLKVDTNLVLNTDPGEWAKNPTFAAYRQSMAALKATNDGAERGIALVTELNSSPLTRDETEFQRIIQVIEEDRKLCPGVSKQELTIK
jgi:hypothetical protein